MQATWKRKKPEKAPVRSRDIRSMLGTVVSSVETLTQVPELIEID